MVNPNFIESIQAGLNHWDQQLIETDSFQAFELHQQNIYRIVQFGLELPETCPMAMAIALKCFDFVEQKGYWQEWLILLQKGIYILNCEETQIRFNALVRLGQMYRLNHQFDQAIKVGCEAEVLARDAGDDHWVAQVYYNFSEAYLAKHAYQRSESYGYKALELFDQYPSAEKWQASLFNLIGKSARVQGDLVSAKINLQKAIKLAEKLKLVLYQVRFLNNLSLTYQDEDDYIQAQDCLKQALDLLNNTPNELDKCLVHINLGLLFFRQEDWSRAEETFRLANSPYLQKSSHFYYQALVANNIGNALLKQKKYKLAKSYLNRALGLWFKVQDDLELANSLGSLAEVCGCLGERDEARQLYAQAVELLLSFPENAWAKKLLNSFQNQRLAM